VAFVAPPFASSSPAEMQPSQDGTRVSGKTELKGRRA
jgi:hypothetical protein